MVIVLRDGTEHALDDERAAAVRKQIAKGRTMLDLDGNGEAIVSLSAIAQIVSDEQFETLFGRRPKTVVLEVPKPIVALPRVQRPTTPWKREQFAELKRRFGERLKVPVEQRGPWLAWLETEEEFRAVMAGKKPWPQLEPKAKSQLKTVYRWVRKMVTDKAYHAQYANRPGYHVLEVLGSDVAIGFRRMVTQIGVPASGNELPPGESWANAAEIAILQDRV